MGMPQPRRGARVLGPYAHGSGFRVVEVGADGRRNRRQFEDRQEAELYIKFVEQRLAADTWTTQTALDKYERDLKERGNKPGSIERTRWSIEAFFPKPLPMFALRPKKCAELYERLRTEPRPSTGRPLSADSHRNALAEVKTFLSWCVEQGWIAENPAAEIKGVGRRRKRKPQLRIKQIRAWYAKAMELAQDGDDGAIAALVALLMGLRASEITQRLVADLDEEEEPFDTLWIPDAKTDAGRRALEVPEELRPLFAGLAEGRVQEAFIFAVPDSKKHTGPRHRKPHWRDWPRKQVKRICELAGVPEMTAHGMRGQLASLSMRQGISGIAPYLGHESERTTRESYAEPGAADEGMRKRGLRVVTGSGNASHAHDSETDDDFGGDGIGS